MTKVWTKEAIIDLLATSDEAVIRALKSIVNRKLVHEPIDWVLVDIHSKLPRYNDHMTPRQYQLVRNRLKNYWKELLEEIELKGGQVCYSASPAQQRPAAVALVVPTPPPVDDIWGLY